MMTQFVAATCPPEVGYLGMFRASGGANILYPPMNWQLLIFAIAALVVLGADRTGLADEMLTSKTGNLQIRVPENFDEAPPVKPAVKIQAIDDAEHSVIMVLSEPKAGFSDVQAYGQTVRDQMLAKLRDGQSDGGRIFALNKLPAIVFEITGIGTNGLRMAFLLTVIETDSRYNQVIGSCLRTDFERHKATFASIARTLKETEREHHEK